MNERAAQFHALHHQPEPLLLYNVWDVGSARAVAAAGGSAIATGSWSVAAAMGFDDGQELPLELLLQLASRIVTGVDLPVSVDFESGYATEPSDLRETSARLLATGVVGVNFEDQRIGDTGVFPPGDQARRIEAVRAAASHAGVDLFINARTDLFLQAPSENHERVVADAVTRGRIYKEAGASGFFVPGLTDAGLIQRVCSEVNLPVNVMRTETVNPAGIDELQRLGIKRVSHGPAPYRLAMGALQDAAARALTT